MMITIKKIILEFSIAASYKRQLNRIRAIEFYFEKKNGCFQDSFREKNIELGQNM